MTNSPEIYNQDIPDTQSVDKLSADEQDRVKYLLTIAKADIGDNRIVGYHGLSIEALQTMIRQGKLPGHSRDSNASPHLPQQGDLYFMPIQSRFPQFTFSEPFSVKQRAAELGINLNIPDETPLSTAEGYAGDIASKHFILIQCGLDVTDKQNFRFVDEFERNYEYPRQEVEFDFQDEEYMADMMRTHNITLEDLKRIQKEVKKRKGFVLGISQAITDSHEILPGEGDDLRIRVPGGFPLNGFIALEALGPAEEEFLADLEKRLNPSVDRESNT